MEEARYDVVRLLYGEAHATDGPVTDLPDSDEEEVGLVCHRSLRLRTKSRGRMYLFHDQTPDQITCGMCRDILGLNKDPEKSSD